MSEERDKFWCKVVVCALGALLAVVVTVQAGTWFGREVLGRGDGGVEQIRCEEDMPCWDCHTMGNKICGPGAG